MTHRKASRKTFSQQFRRFSGALAQEPYSSLFDWLNQVDQIQMLLSASRDHGKPAVGGVARRFQAYCALNGICVTNELKQFVGAVTCAIMEVNGWRKTGRKGRVGVGGFVVGERYQQWSISELIENIVTQRRQAQAQTGAEPTKIDLTPEDLSAVESATTFDIGSPLVAKIQELGAKVAVPSVLGLTVMTWKARDMRVY